VLGRITIGYESRFAACLTVRRLTSTVPRSHTHLARPMIQWWTLRSQYGLMISEARRRGSSRLCLIFATLHSGHLELMSLQQPWTRPIQCLRLFQSIRDDSTCCRSWMSLRMGSAALVRQRHYARHPMPIHLAHNITFFFFSWRGLRSGNF